MSDEEHYQTMLNITGDLIDDVVARMKREHECLKVVGGVDADDAKALWQLAERHGIKVRRVCELKALEARYLGDEHDTPGAALSREQSRTLRRLRTSLRDDGWPGCE